MELSESLRSVVDNYIDRIYQFFEFSTNQSGLKASLRHIEIISVQLVNDLEFFKSKLTDNDTEFIYSILKDSYYFEKYHQSDLWKVTMLRMTWNRLIEDMNYESIDPDKIIIEKNLYVDTSSRKDGRHIYEMYNTEK